MIRKKENMILRNILSDMEIDVLIFGKILWSTL